MLTYKAALTLPLPCVTSPPSGFPGIWSLGMGPVLDTGGCN